MEEEAEAEEPDPRAALMAMLSKRAPEEPKDKVVEEEAEAEKPDPRAALMAMLSKRAPPSAGGKSKSKAVKSNQEGKEADPTKYDGACSSIMDLGQEKTMDEQQNKEERNRPSLREDPTYSKVSKNLAD